MIVEIDAGGRKVRAECSDNNLAPRELIGDVLAAWQATDGAVSPTQGPAFGLNVQQRVNAVSPMNMREPRAEDG